MKTKPSRPHRVAERAAVKNARYHIKSGNYREAMNCLAIALEQSTAADVKDSWWRPAQTGGKDG